jgi:Tol biopolymer transport system component/tRNA A-37 threonylcarbamoyl transferase component Bud32
MTMERLRASLADRYHLDRELGQGGMATVYLADDLRHERKVAIKVLRPELAAVIGAERFLREIKTIANLQHPHILGLIDSGEVNGTAYYVMPFVEGESLRDRLAREKQLPIADAVRVATEVAGALDYAHRHGVVHRDIKPENILLHDGQALVADFGIALAVTSAGGTRMTETGMSLGTPHYMSPEQAMGEREITARSDVYALGAMTYEMLLGEPPFTGPTAQAIVAKVMTEKPAPLGARRETVSPAVEQAVLTALAKLPADRFGSAAEFSAALTGMGTLATGTRPRAWLAGSRTALRAASAVAAIASIMAAFFAYRLTHQPVAPITRLMLDLPGLRVNHLGYYGPAFTLAPDGSRLAYVSEPPGAPTRLMVRELGELTPRSLPGTEGADGPFFSPDGRWIGYTVAGKIYKVAVSGGAPVLLADGGVDVIASGAWLPDDRILFMGRAFSLLSVSAAGGPVTMISPPPSGYALAFPTALPRKDAILITECGNNCAQMALVALNLKTLARDTVLPRAPRGWYLPNGYLVAVQQDGTVRGGAFDLDRLRFTRPPEALLSSVQLELGITPEMSIADNGTLVYLGGNQAGSDAVVASVDRSGNARTLDPNWVARFTSLALSPDGRRLAVSSLDGADNVLWVKQLDAGPLTRLSFGGNLNYRPAWRPDGRSLSFTSDLQSPLSLLFQTRADGSGKPERVLLPGDTTQVDEADWSRDGRWLVYRTGVTAGFRDIYARRVSGDSSRITVSAGPFDEYMPALSPDGRWIAYVSVESGREEVYVRPFPQTDRARWQVSTAGGAGPAWSHSGRELFYVDRGDSMIVAGISTAPDFQVTSRRALFSARPFVLLPYHRSYEIGEDDRSFLMFRRSRSSGDEANRLTVVLNWFQELESRSAAAP